MIIIMPGVFKMVVKKSNTLGNFMKEELCFSHREYKTGFVSVLNEDLVGKDEKYACYGHRGMDTSKHSSMNIIKLNIVKSPLI